MLLFQDRTDWPQLLSVFSFFRIPDAQMPTNWTPFLITAEDLAIWGNETHDCDLNDAVFRSEPTDRNPPRYWNTGITHVINGFYSEARGKPSGGVSSHLRNLSEKTMRPSLHGFKRVLLSMSQPGSPDDCQSSIKDDEWRKRTTMGHLCVRVYSAAKRKP